MERTSVVLYHSFPRAPQAGGRDEPAQLHDLATARMMRGITRTVTGNIDALQRANAQNIAHFCDALFEGSLKLATFWMQVAFPYGNPYQQAKMGQVLRTLNGLQYD